MQRYYITASKVARIAQRITNEHAANVERRLTTVREAYEAYEAENIRDGYNRERERDAFVRVGRYLGFKIKRVGNAIYENGVYLWTIGGN